MSGRQRRRRPPQRKPDSAAPIVAVRVDGIAAGGAGVGRLPDGRAVFVHRTAPGDLAQVRVTQQRDRWARATLVALEDSGPDRRQAPCPHYARCGGCTLEHLDYDAQRAAKGALVQEALRRVGGLSEAPRPEVVASPTEFRYRNRVSFALVRNAGRLTAGFHELEHPERVLDITGECLQPEPRIAEAWDALREAWGPSAERLPAGPRLRLTLRGTAAGVVTLLIEGGRGRGEPETLLRQVPGLASVWHRPVPEARLKLLAGAERVEELWGDQRIGVGGALFLQVNRAAAALLEAHVLALAGEVTGMKIIDAYCGVGVHARRLAARGAEVVGIELDRQAIAEARRALPDARWIEGAVESHIVGALPADLVIVNPPRGGLAAEVATALAAVPPRTLLYISCDPATLARDIARLGGAFVLCSVRCFDLFPQTAHVETVAELKCAIS